MAEFKTALYLSSPFSNKLFIQPVLSQTSSFFFNQPGLNVNDGIADGTTALMVAAMLGNNWAITRWGKCATPRKEEKTYCPDLLGKTEGQFQFNWMTSTAPMFANRLVIYAGAYI